MTPKDPCGVTKSQKCKNKVGDMTVVSMTTFNVSELGVYHVCCKMSNFAIPHIFIMSEVTWLTWPQMTCMRNSRYSKCEYSGACYFLKVSSSWERLPDISSVEKLRHFVTVRRCTYLWRRRSVTWPDVKMKQFIMSGLNGGLVMPKFISLSLTAPEQSQENRFGGTKLHRPARVNLETNAEKISGIQIHTNTQFSEQTVSQQESFSSAGTFKECIPDSEDCGAAIVIYCPTSVINPRPS